jgi:hypothetical protein
MARIGMDKTLDVDAHGVGLSVDGIKTADNLFKNRYGIITHRQWFLSGNVIVVE